MLQPVSDLLGADISLSITSAFCAKPSHLVYHQQGFKTLRDFSTVNIKASDLKRMKRLGKGKCWAVIKDKYANKCIINLIGLLKIS